MSLCFRAIPGRLSSLVSGRKPLSKLDRQLQKHIESCTFLEQFLGTQRALSIEANTTGKASVPFSCILHQNSVSTSTGTHNQWNDKLVRKHNEDNSATYWVQPSRPNRSQKLNIALSKDSKHVAPIKLTSNDVMLWNRTFQTQSIIRNDKNSSFLDNSRILSLESSHSMQQSNTKGGILFTDGTTTLKPNQQRPPADNDGKPSQEQLQCVFDCLSQDLPKLFVKPQNYGIYTEDIIFINNIRGVTTKGLLNYVKQMSLLKAVGHIRFAHVKCDVIKITMHVEDATVKVRWRIRGVTGMKMFFMFWKYKIWKIRDAIERDHELWYDGFSTFYVNGDGRIYKHVADKAMPDQDVLEKEKDLRIAPKLALFTGLMNMFDNDDDFFGLNSTLKLNQLK